MRGERMRRGEDRSGGNDEGREGEERGRRAGGEERRGENRRTGGGERGEKIFTLSILATCLQCFR